MTIMELREKIRERHGVGVGCGTVWRFLARHRITRKKKTGTRRRKSQPISTAVA
jgi:transposase